ncbi:MAG: hypothetical protein R3F59_19055 [Myxococcota bacterium]
MQSLLEPMPDTDDDDRLPGVCAIGDGDRWSGIGVAVAPLVVLTTATVARRVRTVRFVGASGVPVLEGVRRRVVHPDHDPDDGRCDLALLRLVAPVISRSAHLATMTVRDEPVFVVGCEPDGAVWSVPGQVLDLCGSHGPALLTFVARDDRLLLAGIATRSERRGQGILDVAAHGAWVRAVVEELTGYPLR